jgi:hypothetical protein
VAFQKVYYVYETPDGGPDPYAATRWHYAWPGPIRDLMPVLALLGIASSLYFLPQTLRSINLRVAIHQDGFHYQRWGRHLDCRWADVESFFYLRKRVRFLFAWNTYFLEVHRRDGAFVTFPFGTPAVVQAVPVFRGVEEFCESIADEATRALRPGTIAALARGETVWFGPDLALDWDGLAFRQERMAWQDIRDARARGGNLVVRGRDADRGWVVGTGQVANLDVLLELMDDRARLGAQLAAARQARAGLPAAGRPGQARRPRPAGLGYACPRCGGLAQRGAASSAAGAMGGLAGALAGLAFGSFHCATCGPIPRREFPAAIRWRMALNSALLVLAAVLCVAAAVTLAVLVRRR